jgi:hypothetical protein
MTGQVIAIVASGGTPELLRAERRGGIQPAMTVLRAVLERGGRVLLAGEAPVVVPLVMAAAEYLEPRDVETSELGSPPPLILGPLVTTNSVEDKLLVWRPEPQEGAVELSLLDALSASGLIDVAERDEERPEGTAQRFRSILEELVPVAIFAVGEVSGTAVLLDAGESYRNSRSDRAPLLVQLLFPDGADDSRPQWRRIGSADREYDEPPPKMDGRIVGEELDPEGLDDELVALARRAAGEASLTLAIDRVVGGIMDETAEAASPA